ncbi:MAG: glycosyltransferase family 2 protein [Wenzhouxiangella sp.]|nr:MAG: glycosyltransferase family 2 protein [Wenzhouxiangella sp.]
MSISKGRERLQRWRVSLHALLKLPRPPPFFQADWYLVQYPDVAAAGEHPWSHFHLHGRHEGRFANPEHIDLWFDETLFQKVHAEFSRTQGSLSSVDRDYMNWLFARRFAAHGRWREVVETLDDRDFEAKSRQTTPFGHMPGLLYADALRRRGDLARTAGQLARLETIRPDIPDVALLGANMVRSADGDTDGWEPWLDRINALYTGSNLLPLRLAAGSGPALDRLTAAPGREVHGPTISVLMAAWNAQQTIGTALKSLLAQTHSNLEIIVIDDGCEDDTVAVIQDVAAQDSRVRILESGRRRGPYAARNQGLNAASGEFITVHDADDWSHPQKIERQLDMLRHLDELKACFSSWVRVTPDLEFGGWDTPPSWLGWVHRNTSSLLFRREVFEQLGYWDELRCSCDEEYVERIRAAWGARALGNCLPSVPLAFGRAAPQSITRQPETHLLTVLKGLRKDYHDAFRRWHAAARSREALFMPQSPQRRPFPVADAMQPDHAFSAQNTGP